MLRASPALLAVLAFSTPAALARPDEFEFDTDSGGVTKNGAAIFAFEGSPITAQPTSAGIRT